MRASAKFVLAAIALCMPGRAQTCAGDQPVGIRKTEQPDKVCRYDRPATTTQPGGPYWWQLLFDRFRWKPAASNPPFARSVAFLAGVGKYQHLTPQLDFVRNDLRELRNYLLTEGGFDTVYEVRDENVTADLFNDYMRDRFTRPGPLLTAEDRLLIYYSGHGAAQNEQVPYLQFTGAAAGNFSRHVLPARDVYDWARAIVAKHLLIVLDSCASGLVTADAKDGEDASALTHALAGEPSGTLLTAGTGDEKAYAIKYSEQGKASVFTRALLDALRSGQADRQNRGLVTIGEALETAKVSVAGFQAVEGRKMTPRQTPLYRRAGPAKGNFIFINAKANEPTLPGGVRGSLLAKAGEADMDPGLTVMRFEYEEVKSSESASALHAFVKQYKGKPYGQALVSLIEDRLRVLERPQPPPGLRQGDRKVNPNDGQTYVWIPPGAFRMGCSPGDDECQDDEKPSREVAITSGFWMAQTEVTVEAYRKFAASTKRQMPPEPLFEGRNLNPDWAVSRAPIVNVTWEDANAYCPWIGGRLPTEAQWEYAARGGVDRSRYGTLGQIAWFADNSGISALDSQELWDKQPDSYFKRLSANENRFQTVGRKAPNAFGLYDMLGNAWEWVSDWYGEHYYQGGDRRDPAGPPNGEFRALRGGSWIYDPRYLRVSFRLRIVPSFRDGVVGFRCVWEAFP